MKIYKILGNILNIAAQIFEGVGMFALIMLMLILFGQTVVGWGGVSLLWTDEVCFMMNFWVVFLGAAALIYGNKHIQVDFITSKLSITVQAILEILRNVLGIAVCIYMMGSTASYISATENIATTILKIPRYMYYFVPLITFCYFILVFIYQMLRVIFTISEGETES